MQLLKITFCYLNVTGLYNCIRYHRSFGFRRKRRLKPRSFGKHSLPMILHWNKGVFTLTNMRIYFYSCCCFCFCAAAICTFQMFYHKRMRGHISLETLATVSEKRLEYLHWLQEDLGPGETTSQYD
jgi:hypothetical protein